MIFSKYSPKDHPFLAFGCFMTCAKPRPCVVRRIFVFGCFRVKIYAYRQNPCTGTCWETILPCSRPNRHISNQNHARKRILLFFEPSPQSKTSSMSLILRTASPSLPIMETFVFSSSFLDILRVPDNPLFSVVSESLPYSPESPRNFSDCHRRHEHQNGDKVIIRKILFENFGSSRLR